MHIILFVSLFLVIFIPIFNSKNVVAETNQNPKLSSTNDPIIATKDTYVNTFSATSNYGGQDWLYTGMYFGSNIVEAYFCFPLTSKPDSWSKAEISLNFWSVGETLKFNISLIEESCIC